MTAYSSMQTTIHKKQIQITIQSVNHKNLRINLHINASPDVEAELKKLFEKELQRGNFDIKINCEEEHNEKSDFKEWIAECKKDGLPEPSWSDYFYKKSNTKTVTNLDSLQSALKPKIKIVIEQYLKHAETEAKNLLQYLKKYIKSIEQNLSKVKKELPSLRKEKTQHFKEQIHKLSSSLGADVKSKLIQECALLIEKIDVSEEVDRLQSHLQTFNKILNDDWRGGKVLDFLCQEINREINTLTTKSQSSKISMLCVTMKSELEKVREQVQNFA
jgi:uncharacterized protein (TIGR00255 family)